MSERSLRTKERFDYKVFNDKGIKIVKNTRTGFDIMANLIDQERKIVCKISTFMTENDLSLLFEIEAIEKAITELRSLMEAYKEVHFKLESELGDEYSTSYEGFDMQITEIKDWFRQAKLEIKRKKDEEHVELVEVKLSAEEKYFRCRITQELDNMSEEESVFLEDLDRNISVSQNLLREYTEIFVKIEEVGNDFRKQFSNAYEEQCLKLNTFIKKTRKKMQSIRTDDLKVLEENRVSKKIDDSNCEKIRKISCCKNMYENICDRLSNLENKCFDDMSRFTDIQLLEMKKDVKYIDSGFNDILDRITTFCGSNPFEFQETEEMTTKVNERKRKLKNSIDSHKNILEKEIATRDLSEEKLKNASLLGINLPKFKGYESSMDFYTFKSEFEKLIVPRVQAQLLPDYIKNNYLDGQAFQLVKELDDLRSIWERLQISYGNVTILLNNKFREIENGVPLWKIRDDEKIVQSIIKIKNTMLELISLAKKHRIEQNLFHSSNLAKIYNIIGKKRHVEITKKLLGSNKTDQEKWYEIIEFLDNELKLKEELLLFERSYSKDNNSSKTKSHEENPLKSYNAYSSENKKCIICGKSDHVPTITSKGNAFINYFSCEKFVKMNPKQRFEELKRKKLCFQCLTPGLKVGHEGKCFDRYKCPNESHRCFKSGIHVLICNRHKNDQANLELLDVYKSNCILHTNNSYSEFSKNIGISFHVKNKYYKVSDNGTENEDSDMGIYMLQTIKIGDQKFNVFFDSGCGDMVCKKSAIDLLDKQNRAENIVKGPLVIGGVGDLKSVSDHGRFRVTIPLYDGKSANLSGICLDKITSTFPLYPLAEVEKDIIFDYTSRGGDPQKLPKLPEFVGGDTDLMIGIQYSKYYPKEVHKLPNGLSIFESQFLSPDGSRGLVGGPHKVFTEIHKSLSNNHMYNMSTYFSEIAEKYRNGFKIGIDTSLLYEKANVVPLDEGKMGFDDFNKLSTKKCESNYESISEIGGNTFINKKAPKSLKQFEKVEAAGTEASYRCIRCRGCTDCKISEKIDSISIKEEVEQGVIDKSVKVVPNEGITIARLPFLCDPKTKLISNQKIAEKIYWGQVKKLNSNQKDKQDVIDAMKKLVDLGFVDRFDNLTNEQKELINSSLIKYIIPWRAVWNTNSISTPCRPVFDASHPTETGFSLNDILAKGKNNMNHLVQIFIRWLIRVCAFHTDVQKMYNTVRLVEAHWCYQLFLFHNELNMNVNPLLHVIKTLIYGVKPSGNQAEKGIRETAEISKEAYPRQYEIIHKDVYVDDCLSGEKTYEEAKEVTDGLQIVLNKGGFRLKGITFSGYDPPDHLCNDGKSLTVAGMKWFPKADLISLNVGDLNFAKKIRGKKNLNLKNFIPDKFTKRECAGRIGEIFDLIGRFTPITAEFKLDLNELTTRKLDWDDFVPMDLLPKWKKNFEIISELKEIKFQRCIVPEDAINLDMETIEMADSSLKIACSAVYVRFKKKNGLNSCQLVFARSKIHPSYMTIPRGELFAAELNATTGHVVNLSLSDYIKSRTHLTDSQVALSWIHSTQAQLKQWVRGRVIEINRLTNRNEWYYIESGKMMADLGTRRGAKLSDVSENSPWIIGHEWAKYGKEHFPIKSISDIKLSKEELKGYSEEKLDLSDTNWINKQLSDEYLSYVTMNDGELNEISQRSKFSNYVIDPNKFRFRKIVRIVALIFKFIKNLKGKIGKANTVEISESKIPSQFSFCNDKYLVTQEKTNSKFACQSTLIVELSNENLITALNYFYKKATLEVKHFLDKNSYKNISVEKCGILYYSGRILPSQRFDNKLNLSDVCIDLSMASFCVPLIEKYSPLAYAIINEVHWYNYDAKHSGNETVMRYTQMIAHIIAGKSLVKLFREDCPRCNYLRKKAISVAMGPKSCDNLRIAPAFYSCQTDLFGPYSSYSSANKRATIKVWFVIFCCCATGAVDIKVAEDYSTSSFVQAFIRFSCKVGYPRKILPDAGSQLVKGCQSMKITFTDIYNRLHEYGVEFEVCPVGAHYMHGKVERKIKHVKESFAKNLQKERLSVIQWETLGDQVANSINNLPIAIGNVTKDLENIDLLTPNRLLLARNNNRCPVGSIVVSEDVGKIIQHNNKIFEAWFRSWLISYVPDLMVQPKWFKSDRDPKKGDIVLFLKSDKEFDKQYQYGMICDLKVGRDGKIRRIDIEYQNYTEKVKRVTNRGTREVVIIHPYNELGLIRELNLLSGRLP